MAVFRKTDTFNIFQQCVPDYSWQTILDFGGNRGNLLTSSAGAIDSKKYTCLDISKEGLSALPEGIKSVHWNRYHSYYNPNGTTNEPFPKLKWYDIVFANSVFTHNALDEVLYCIRHLSKYSNRIVFTYIDPKNKVFLARFKEKYYDLNFEDKLVSYTTDKNGILWSAYNTEHLKEHLNYYNVTAGTTTWFNYIDIQVNPPTPCAVFGY